MKQKIFKKFQAKSLDKESQKSIVGGDWYSCVADCMNAEYAYFLTNCETDCSPWEAVCYLYGICQPECYQNPNRTSWSMLCIGFDYCNAPDPISCQYL